MAAILQNILYGSPQPHGYGITMAPHSARRSPEQCVNLPKNISFDLGDLIRNGIAQLPLDKLSGTLHITNNRQLIARDPHTSSDGYCIVHFAYSSNRFITFEIDLNRNVLTVARKPSADPKASKRAFSSCLEHEATLPLLEKIISEAKFQMMYASIGEVSGSTSGQVKGVATGSLYPAS